jgi:hypothetical protein
MRFRLVGVAELIVEVAKIAIGIIAFVVFAVISTQIAVAQTSPKVAAKADVPVNAFGNTAANITACPALSDYQRFYKLLDDDPSAAFAFARDHACVELEGNTSVKVAKIVGDTSCVLPSGTYDCVWTSSHRIKSFMDAETRAITDEVNRVFDRAHPECKRKNKPDYCY